MPDFLVQRYLIFGNLDRIGLEHFGAGLILDGSMAHLHHCWRWSVRPLNRFRHSFHSEEIFLLCQGRR